MRSMEIDINVSTAAKVRRFSLDAVISMLTLKVKARLHQASASSSLNAAMTLAKQPSLTRMESLQNGLQLHSQAIALISMREVWLVLMLRSY